MNFFGMGPMEIMVIMVVALIIFGPGKLPELGAQAGKAVRDFRRATQDITAEFQDSIEDVQSSVGEVKQTMRDVQRETREIAASIPAAVEGNGSKPPVSAAKRAELAAQDTATTGTVPAAPTATIESDAEPEPAPPAVASRENPFADLESLDDEQVPDRS